MTPAAISAPIIQGIHWEPHIQSRTDLFVEMQQLLCRMDTTKQALHDYSEEIAAEIDRLDKEHKAHQVSTDYRKREGLTCESGRIAAYRYWTYLATRTVYTRLKQTFDRFVSEVDDAGTEWAAYYAHPQDDVEEHNLIVSVLMKYETAADILQRGVAECWMPDAAWLKNHASIETVTRHISGYVLAVKDACSTYLQTCKGENPAA